MHDLWIEADEIDGQMHLIRSRIELTESLTPRSGQRWSADSAAAGENGSVPNPQSGAMLDAYRIEDMIGSGSVGDVFRGIDIRLNRRVAIKLLSMMHRRSALLRQRFAREGRAIAAISHPNIVQVFATGSFDDRPYIVMELLDGADLGSIVERSGWFNSLAAAHAVLDAAQGLAAAARAGLIHRDVKPSNLVQLSDGRVKVTDFGLAKPITHDRWPGVTDDLEPAIGVHDDGMNDC